MFVMTNSAENRFFTLNKGGPSKVLNSPKIYTFNKLSIVPCLLRSISFHQIASINIIYVNNFIKKCVTMPISVLHIPKLKNALRTFHFRACCNYTGTLENYTEQKALCICLRDDIIY